MKVVLIGLMKHSALSNKIKDVLVIDNRIKIVEPTAKVKVKKLF